MLTPDRLWVAATEILAAVSDGYDLAGLDLPARRYVGAGTPAYDCEQVVVWVSAMGSHSGEVAADFSTSLTAHPAWSLRYAAINVSILRCVPVLDDEGNPPDVLDEERASSLILEDAIRADNYLTTAAREGRLASCNSIAWAGWQQIPPEGGLAGGTLAIRVGLE